jgi:hypothetical protein
VGDRPADIALADVNGDGPLDLLTANSRSNNVSILLGNGRGGFAPAPGSPLAGGPVTHLLALGDVNGDSHLDLAVTCHDSNDAILYLGNGHGGFRAAPGSPFPLLQGTAPHNHGLALGDFNGDRKLDLATSNQNHRSVSVLLGDGQGRFRSAPGSPFLVGGAPYPLALGDLNGDGALDIVTPNLDSRQIAVLLGNGRGGFAPAPGSPFPVLPRPYFVALGDLNGDRWLDVVASHDDISLLTVLLGDGQGGFRPASGSSVDVGSRAGEILLRDMNSDGRVDLVTGTDAHQVVVLLGEGDGGFRPAAGSPFAVGRGPWGLALGDVNGDSKIDIVTANLESNDVSVLLAQ